MRLILKLLLTAVVVVFLAYFLPGVATDGYIDAIILAVILGILNLILRPIIVLLTLPITILTLGLFLLVINAFIVLIADSLLSGFDVDGFWWALIFSLLLTILQSIVNAILD